MEMILKPILELTILKDYKTNLSAKTNSVSSNKMKKGSIKIPPVNDCLLYKKPDVTDGFEPS